LGIVVLVGALGIAGGCSSGSGKDRPTPATAASTPAGAARGFDPPVKFDKTKVTLSEPQSQLVLYERSVFVSAADGLRHIDAESGTERATFRPVGKVANVGGTGPPVLVEVDGKAVVLAPFITEQPGQGTAKATYAIEVVMVDAAAARMLATTVIPLTDGLGGVRAVGVSGHTLVLDVVNRPPVVDDQVKFHAGYAVDLSTRRTLWNRKEFAPAVVAGGVTVGRVPGDGLAVEKTLALSLDGGAERWTYAGRDTAVDVQPGGPAVVVVTGHRYSQRDRYLVVLGTDRGDQRGTVTSHPTAKPVCHFDMRSLTVCSSSDAVTAFDATTGTVQWEIKPGGDRIVPRVTAAWHGAVYAQAKGPVVLDGATGADKETAPGAAPRYVNQYLGIAGVAGVVSGEAWTVFRAVG
jgi:outer membrane protein assembly factor BamB